MLQNQRSELALNMIDRLIELQSNLNGLMGDIKALSETIFHETCTSKLQELQQNKTIFEKNSQQIHTLNTQAIMQINSWHAWSKEPSALRTVLYPIKFFIKKHNLNKNIMEINKKIMQISIENRLLSEKMLSWENEVKRIAEIKLKESSLYIDYNETLLEKKKLIDDTTYILSTLSIECTGQIDLSDSAGLNRIRSQLKPSSQST